ncbi:MAG: gamma-glutamyltransferase, partial [Pseudomonadota bacterium]|nr:gamma-glutamyltransferase [Pseudomonadota bacterium]
MMRQTKFLLLFILIVVGCTVDRTPEAPTPATAIRPAAIAIPDPYAADVAEAILRQGGNAVDAAVATGFALAVTYVDAGNIGGGGFMTTFMNGESAFLDYREAAPGAGNRDMYLDEHGEV